MAGGLADLLILVPCRPLRKPGSRVVAMRTFQLYVYAMNSDSSAACDLLIEPVDIAGFGYLGSKQGMEMYRIGYDAAKKQLETFKNW